jgi:hypothetical protein
MGEWDGLDRLGQGIHDPDWLQHKMSMLNDIKELKEESKETKSMVVNMQVTLEVLKTKLMTIITVAGFVMGILGGLVPSFFGK